LKLTEENELGNIDNNINNKITKEDKQCKGRREKWKKIQKGNLKCVPELRFVTAELLLSKT